MVTRRLRLTRHEIDLLLKREYGSKARLAKLARVRPAAISRWLRDSSWHSRAIEAAADGFALAIADRQRLSREEVYVDGNMSPDTEESCETTRGSFFV